ncbi:hypothetical protein [Phenylobacterium deserti]|uniref:Glycosyl transferase family 1 domain-containing protein n=1 Tax=Phenylobacterium deserti TaxID=1914756 RepID=A0A328ATI3_9CAUL|nr:hypothetical protein [Phenylobacterium deserti]RAK57869.1 hypothetical protein DJ018_08150 [Phenylobacterium deserti]
MAVSALDDEVLRVVSAAVDVAFYRAVYPELDAPGFDPVRHYVEKGWRDGRDPAPWFSVRDYLAMHPDVASAEQEPLYHYLTEGRREGRKLTPSEHGEGYLRRYSDRGVTPAWRFEPRVTPRVARPVVSAPKAVSDEDRALVATEFNADFYNTAYPDVAAAGFEPLNHFLVTGWLEGRDPNPRFSVRDYLETYPDIGLARINPFVHYLRTGRAEGRMPRNQLGFRFEILSHGKPVAERIAEAQAASEEFAARPVEDLASGLASSRTGLKDLHLTFSHDDYTANLGGLQLCLQREDARVAELGRDHLHLYPARHWPVLRTLEAAPLGVLLNGQHLGFFSVDDIVGAFGAAADESRGARSLALHSLLGHKVDEVLAICGALGLTEGFFWLHDFASLCAGYHLLRNDVQDCAAPPPDSAACRVCAYGPWRGRHLEEHERLFRGLRLTVVSPSEPTLKLWRDSWTFPHVDELILPHATLLERAPAAAAPEGPLRVAYIGFPAAHKGWPVFRDLVQRLEADERYRFLHLGSRRAADLVTEFHAVDVTDANPRAMQEAIETLALDVVIMWPLCRETFSFTAYEAIAGGAAVVTGPDSGNIAAVVQRGHGRVMPDEAALALAFEDGSIADLSRASRRPMLYDLAFSGLTVDLLSAVAK